MGASQHPLRLFHDAGHRGVLFHRPDRAGCGGGRAGRSLGTPLQDHFVLPARALGLKGARGGSGEPASAWLPSSNIVWESEPTSWPQSAEPRAEADKGTLKDELQPHGCRLIIFPTHLTEVTQSQGNGLHWAGC